MPQLCSKHVKRTDGSEHYRLRVPSGKDTTDNGGKPRDAYLPAHVERDLHRYQTREGLDATVLLVDLSDRRVRAIVNECAHRAADATGDTDFRYVNSHDLRRRFAQRLLVDHSMNPRVVMAVGGWGSFQAIEPYLSVPLPPPEVVNDAFEEAGLA